MKPYKTIRLTDAPDVGDIKSEGRKTSIGRIPRGEITDTWKNSPKVVHNDRGYVKPKKKAATRRALKRADRQRVAKELEEA